MTKSSLPSARLGAVAAIEAAARRERARRLSRELPPADQAARDYFRRLAAADGLGDAGVVPAPLADNPGQVSRVVFAPALIVAALVLASLWLALVSCDLLTEMLR